MLRYKIVTGIVALVILWFAVSFVNTISHNLTDYEYAKWNMFDLFVETKEVPVEPIEFEPLSDRIDSNIEWLVKVNRETIEADMQAIEKLDKVSNNISYDDTVEETPEYRAEDLEILAHVINGEAGAEYVSDETRYYVGSVVLNRVDSEYYPNTIEEVVFQYGQYECTWNGMYDRQPTESCYRIAKDLLVNGSKLPSNVLLQANFIQGDSVYSYQDTIYFCTWR